MSGAPLRLKSALGSLVLLAALAGVVSTQQPASADQPVLHPTRGGRAAVSALNSPDLGLAWKGPARATEHGRQAGAGSAFSAGLLVAGASDRVVCSPAKFGPPPASNPALPRGPPERHLHQD